MLDKTTKRREYASPAVNETVAILTDAFMIIPTSALIDRSVIIEGQSVDGYYESADIISDWD